MQLLRNTDAYLKNAPSCPFISVLDFATIQEVISPSGIGVCKSQVSHPVVRIWYCSVLTLPKMRYATSAPVLARC